MSAENRAVELWNLLAQRRPSIQSLLPRHVPVEHFEKTVHIAIGKNPQLKMCVPSSVLECVLRCAELGLDASGTLGHAYLIPFKGICTLVIGYRGYVDLFRRSGGSKVEARAVFAGEHFEYEYGLEPLLRHVPCAASERGELTHAYAIATLSNKDKQFDVMEKPDIDAIRARSRARDSGAWVTDYVEMAKKTVVRRISKLLPQSTEMQKAFEYDFDSPDIVDAEPIKQETPKNQKPSGVVMLKESVRSFTEITPEEEKEILEAEREAQK
jgi:recombination protein RecT